MGNLGSLWTSWVSINTRSLPGSERRNIETPPVKGEGKKKGIEEEVYYSRNLLSGIQRLLPLNNMDS